MSREAVFRGIPVQLVQARVKNRSPELHYYEIRCPDDAWASPATLEHKVAVNFWGTLISRQALDFGGDDYLELTDSEMTTLLVDEESQDETGTGV